MQKTCHNSPHPIKLKTYSRIVIPIESLSQAPLTAKHGNIPSQGACSPTSSQAPFWGRETRKGGKEMESIHIYKEKESYPDSGISFNAEETSYGKTWREMHITKWKKPVWKAASCMLLTIPHSGKGETMEIIKRSVVARGWGGVGWDEQGCTEDF